MSIKSKPRAGSDKRVTMRGKQRTLLVAAALVVVLLAFIAARSVFTDSPHELTVTPVAGVATASADEVARLKSWGLIVSDLPQGTKLLSQTELRNYALARGDVNVEKEIAAAGRVTGYIQGWQQDTAQLQFKVEMELYNSPAAATAQLTNKSAFAGQGQFENLPDPKLGDESAMLGYALTAGNGAKVRGWIVQWVRGRTLLRVSGSGPDGGLPSDVIVRDAQIVDSRAAQAPIR